MISKLSFALLVVVISTITSTTSTTTTDTTDTTTTDAVPIVLWHGMGDSCCNQNSMGKISAFLSDKLGVYVKSIRIGDSSSEDVKSSYFGRLMTQVDQVCLDLSKDENLKNGFNAIGFSQGGQALRAYVQRCNHPRVLNLITIGAQHGGVSDIPKCGNTSDGWCPLMRSIALKGTYLPYIQSRLIQAQYFRDPSNLETYLKQSLFLADINNERDDKDGNYAVNMKTLERFVMVMFMDDEMVYPKESSWFGSLDEHGNVVNLQDQQLYIQDWLGLKALDDEGKLVYIEKEGNHLEISLEWLEKVIFPFLSAPLPRLSIQT